MRYTETETLAMFCVQNRPATSTLCPFGTFKCMGACVRACACLQTKQSKLREY